MNHKDSSVFKYIIKIEGSFGSLFSLPDQSAFDKCGQVAYHEKSLPIRQASREKCLKVRCALIKMAMQIHHMYRKGTAS